MKNNILQLHNQSERTVEKIDCPFSMPMSRKERPPMTKKKTPQTIEECNAEIEKLPVEWNSSSRSIIKGCAYALRKVGNVALR